MHQHPAPETDRALYRRHYDALVDYTDRLRENRCRRTTRFDANVDETLGVFGPLFSAWKMEILFILYKHGPSRFSSLKRRLGGISSRVLTDKLRACTAEGLVRRGADGGRVGYALEDRGFVVARHLHPLLFFLHTH